MAGPRVHGLQPLRFGHRLKLEPDVGWIARARRAAKADRGAGHPARNRDVTVSLTPTRGMAVVARPEHDERPSARERGGDGAAEAETPLNSTIAAAVAATSRTIDILTRSKILGNVGNRLHSGQTHRHLQFAVEVLEHSLHAHPAAER